VDDPDLRTRLTRRLEALVALLPELESPDFRIGRWAGGERLPDGAITMPYFELDERGEALLAVIGRGGWVQPFDWMTWLDAPDGRALAEDPERMSRATPEDLSRILTAIVRSERFGDGNIAGAVESGLILRIVRRAAELLEVERRR